MNKAKQRPTTQHLLYRLPNTLQPLLDRGLVWALAVFCVGMLAVAHWKNTQPIDDKQTQDIEQYAQQFLYPYSQQYAKTLLQHTQQNDHTISQAEYFKLLRLAKTELRRIRLQQEDPKDDEQ